MQRKFHSDIQNKVAGNNGTAPPLERDYMKESSIYLFFIHFFKLLLFLLSLLLLSLLLLLLLLLLSSSSSSSLLLLRLKEYSAYWNSFCWDLSFPNPLKIFKVNMPLT